jgi:hypothetical protein
LCLRFKLATLVDTLGTVVSIDLIYVGLSNNIKKTGDKGTIAEKSRGFEFRSGCALSALNSRIAYPCIGSLEGEHNVQMLDTRTFSDGEARMALARNKYDKISCSKGEELKFLHAQEIQSNNLRIL